MTTLTSNALSDKQTETKSLSIGSQISGYALSYSVTSLLSALLVVFKETNEIALSVMKAATGHHWVSHGMIVVILFVLLGWMFSRLKFSKSLSTRVLIIAIIGSTVLSDLIIAGFYL